MYPSPFFGYMGILFGASGVHPLVIDQLWVVLPYMVLKKKHK
jgi:hypothetical protein